MRGLIAFAAVLFAAGSAEAQQWSDPDLGRSIREGHATREHIWLLGETGKVIRFVRATGERTVAAANVSDLLVVRDRLWVLVHAEGSPSYTIRDLRRSGVGTPALDGQEAPLSLYLHASEYGEALGLLDWPDHERPAVLMSRAVITPAAEGWKRYRLAAELDRYGLTATPDGRSVYVGYNRGEWGGGLRRVDLPSGTISFVTETSDDLCGGVLNPNCQPVVGLFPDLRNPGCVTVGAGLAHLGTSFGRVYRVCGDDIAETYATPTSTQPDRWMLGAQRWPLDSLVPTGDGWIGLSRDRYFRNRGGEVAEHPMPAFRDWAGIRISDESQGVLFLVAACCWGGADLTLYRALALPVAS